MPESTIPEVGKTLTGSHNPIQTIPPAEENMVVSNYDRTIGYIHPLIQPFPPAKGCTVNANNLSASNHQDVEKPAGKKSHARTQSSASSKSIKSSKSGKVNLGSKAGMQAVPHMPPCSECGSNEHQRTHCFFAHPSNLRRFLEHRPWKSDIWEKRVAAHRLKKEEEKKKDYGKLYPCCLCT